MVATQAAFGALLGVGVQLYVNAVRKLPLMRDPWLHVLWAGAGASFGTWLVGFEERTEKDLRGESLRRLGRVGCGDGQACQGRRRPLLCKRPAAAAARRRPPPADGEPAAGVFVHRWQTRAYLPIAAISLNQPCLTCTSAEMLEKRNEANKRLQPGA